PRYERGGTVRQSWSDPLGWAGLQKVPASEAEAEALVKHRLDQVQSRLAEVDEGLAAGRRELRQLATEAASLEGRPELEESARARRARVAEGERDLRRLAAERAGLVDEQAAHVDALAHGLPQPPPQAHLHHRTLPVDRQPDQRRATFLKVWSTVSTPLFFLA